MERNASSTKSGPGRRHANGTKHGKPPVQPKGGLWTGQRTNPERAERRRLIREAGGIRQFKIRSRRSDAGNRRFEETSAS